MNPLVILDLDLWTYLPNEWESTGFNLNIKDFSSTWTWTLRSLTNSKVAGWNWQEEYI